MFSRSAGQNFPVQIKHPFFLQVRERISWWRSAGATPDILDLILHGVGMTNHPPARLSLNPCFRSGPETQLAWETVEEYLQVGALKEINPWEAKHLIPWFVIQKGEKVRLITDCREVNRYLTPQNFKLEGWSEIFPVLRKGMWGAKIDLKHAYFHLGLADDLRPYVCFNVENRIFQYQTACFGLSTLPQQWQSLMKIFLKKWRTAGFLTWVYLDDILLVGASASEVQKKINLMVEDLQAAGLVINVPKSQLIPTQRIEHLGFEVDLAKGVLQVPSGKMKLIRKELGKLLTKREMSTRQMAAILGTVRAFLMAMPWLRAFTDELVQFVNHQKILGWDKKVLIPETLQLQVKELGQKMEEWKGRNFQGKIAVRDLHSDSSTEAWAGLDTRTGQVVQEFWREKRILHINVKELEAAINTVRSLANGGEHVRLSVDNSVAFAYLSKGGGRIPALNKLVRPFLSWCMEKDITLELVQIKSAEDLADAPSRWKQDRGDYTLDPSLFKELVKMQNQRIAPQVDMFASPGNHQLQKFVSRYPHWQATASDALKCPLEKFTEVYANPPWKVIGKWMNRLRKNPRLKCLMITPLWASCGWWPQLLKMHVKGSPAIVIPPYPGMFKNCYGELMPAPRWPLICTVLSGKAWRTNKFRLKTSKLFWPPQKICRGMIGPSAFSNPFAYTKNWIPCEPIWHKLQYY